MFCIKIRFSQNFWCFIHKRHTRFTGEDEGSGRGRMEMKEEEDCGDVCRFKGKEIGSVFFFST